MRTLCFSFGQKPKLNKRTQEHKNIRTMQLFCFSVLVFFCSSVSAGASAVVINEIGAFEQSESEWIEIYNTSDVQVDISGWKFFENETNHRITQQQGDFILESGEYAIIANRADVFVSEKNFLGTVFDSSWGSLKESGEEIGLVDAEENFVERFFYIEARDFSLQRIDPRAPDYLESNWEEHASAHTAGFENVFDILDEERETTNEEEEVLELPIDEALPSSKPGSIIITEVFPNPSGPDTFDEFIEIKNTGNGLIDLSGWYFKNSVGQKFVIENLGLGRDSTYVFFRKQTNLVLPNSGVQRLKLYSSNNRKIDEARFKDAPENKSLSLGIDKKWTWEDPTPWKENKNELRGALPRVFIDAPGEVIAGRVFLLTSSDSFDPDGEALSFIWDFGDGVTTTRSSPFYMYEKKGRYLVTLTATNKKGAFSEASATVRVIDDKKEHPVVLSASTSEEIIASTHDNLNQIKQGSAYNDGEPVGMVEVSGTVLVAPGILGSQIMYVGDQHQGIQVYMHSKDWPELEEGDFVRIVGEFSVARGEDRLKIKGRDDIGIIDYVDIDSAVTSINEVLQMHGALVSVRGEVTESRGASAYVDDSDEIEIAFKKSAEITKEFFVGDEVEVTGIVVRNNSGTRLLPRYQSDVVVVSQKMIDAGNEEVGNEEMRDGENEDGEIDDTQKYIAKNFNFYFIVTIVLLIVLNIFIFFRTKKHPNVDV